MIYVALLFVIATVTFVALRLGLRNKQLNLQQFFTLYGLALLGLVLILLALSGRLHWLFVLIGSALPFFSGGIRWILRITRTAGILRGLRDIIRQTLGGVQRDERHQNQHGRRPANSSQMSVTEALDILSLEPNPSADEIKAAHRVLIQKLHPDRGGSTVLAAQINEAKEVLLNHV